MLISSTDEQSGIVLSFGANQAHFDFSMITQNSSVAYSLNPLQSDAPIKMRPNIVHIVWLSYGLSYDGNWHTLRPGRNRKRLLRFGLTHPCFVAIRERSVAYWIVQRQD